MTVIRVTLDAVLVTVLILGLHVAKVAAQTKFDNSSQKIIARENDEACDLCNAKVKFFDAHGLPKKIKTPKMLSEYLQFDSMHCRDPFCLALRGKYDAFAQSYFDHMQNPEIDPCKVVHIC